MKEATIVKAIRAVLDKRDACFYFKTHGSPYQRAGLPDLIICYKGRFVGVEVKVPGNDVTALQEATLEKIVDAGGIALVAHDAVSVDKVLIAIDERETV